MADLALQPSIATDLRSQALLQLIQRLKDPSLGGTLDLSPILVYRISSLVNSAVLPMAWQWDVLNPLLLLPVISQVGPPSSNLYAQYRSLILLSTKIHSIIGTPAAMMQALAGLGYAGATLLEGQNSWGGSSYPASQGWAVFRIVIPLSSVPAGTNLVQLQTQIIAIANFFKPARCLLDSAVFTTQFTDTLLGQITDALANAFVNQDTLAPLPSDAAVVPLPPVSDVKLIVSLHNAQYYKAASLSYGTAQPLVAEGSLIVNGNPVAHS